MYVRGGLATYRANVSVEATSRGLAYEIRVVGCLIVRRDRCFFVVGFNGSA